MDNCYEQIYSIIQQVLADIMKTLKVNYFLSEEVEGPKSQKVYRNEGLHWNLKEMLKFFRQRYIEASVRGSEESNM